MAFSNASFQGGHPFIQSPCFGVLEHESSFIKRTNYEAMTSLIANFDPTATTDPLGYGGKHRCKQRVFGYSGRAK